MPEQPEVITWEQLEALGQQARCNAARPSPPQLNADAAPTGYRAGGASRGGVATLAPPAADRDAGTRGEARAGEPPAAGGVAAGTAERPYPCPTDVSRESSLGHLFVYSTALYPDGGERRTVVRAVSGESRVRAPFCPEGVCRCPFAFDTIKRNVDNARRTVARARRSVQDNVRCNGLDHLLTLTAGKHFGTRADAGAAWSEYLHDKTYGRWFAEHLGHAYTSVAEPFADGQGWHIHAAIRGRLPQAVLMRLKVTWTLFLSERYGIERPNTRSGLWRVNVQPPKSWQTPKQLGLYLSKYCGKAFDEVGKGEHRYRSGLGMLGPLKASSFFVGTWEQVQGIFEGFPGLFEIRHPVTNDVLGWTSERGG